MPGVTEPGVRAGAGDGTSPGNTQDPALAETPANWGNGPEALTR